jgi:hypothetical protein
MNTCTDEAALKLVFAVQPYTENYWNDDKAAQAILDDYPYAVQIINKLPRFYDAIGVLKFNRNHNKAGKQLRYRITTCKLWLERALSTPTLLNNFGSHDFAKCRDGCTKDMSPSHMEEQERKEIEHEERRKKKLKQYELCCDIYYAYPWRKITADDLNEFKSRIDTSDHWEKDTLTKLEKQSPELRTQVQKTILWFNAQSEDSDGVTVKQFMAVLEDVQQNEKLIIDNSITEARIADLGYSAGVVSDEELLAALAAEKQHA